MQGPLRGFPQGLYKNFPQDLDQDLHARSPTTALVKRDLRTSQNLAPHLARAFAVETHMDISHARIHGKNAAAQMEHPDLTPALALTIRTPLCEHTVWGRKNAGFPHAFLACSPGHQQIPSPGRGPAGETRTSWDASLNHGFSPPENQGRVAPCCSQDHARRGLMASSRGQRTHFPALLAILYFE